MPGDFPVVFALYPDVTQLDFTGPLEVLARLVSDCALLCVPGGFGCAAAMADAEYLAALRRLAARAHYVTSVCTGSLLLGAAGLLEGRRAACHWAFLEMLRVFGALPDARRVVRDGNVFTGGGVTAGIDMALTISAEIAGEDHAQAVQLAMEYAPEPPFDAGHPKRARPEILALVRERFDRVWPERLAAAERAARALARGFADAGGSDRLSGP
jgi:transcriptional regulator GlxA family with amidase domain